MSTDQLDRNPRSLYNRWEKVLKHWILSYYCGALNLNINSMLINHLSSIYQYRDEIDWVEIIKRPEFAGHTTSSLIACLDALLVMAARFLGTDGSKLQLQKVAKLVNDKSIAVSARLSNKKLERQQN